MPRAFERTGRFPFPRDLFEAAGLEPVLAEPKRRPITGVAAGVCKGERNMMLFNTLRSWAYQHVRRFDDLDVWSSECVSRATAINDRFDEPIGSLPGDRADDVCSTAWSVASWCWFRHNRLGGNFCADPAVLQARRRKGGIVHARRRRAAVRDRDLAIVAMLDSGASLRKTAEAIEGATVKIVRTARQRLQVADVERIAFSRQQQFAEW